MGDMADWHLDQMGWDVYDMYEDYREDYWETNAFENLIYMEDRIMAGYSIDVKKKKSVSVVCRGSYVNILNPKAFEDGDDEVWGLQCQFPKSDPELEPWMQDLKKIYAQVLIDKFGQEKAQKLAKTVKIPLRDGDDPQEADKELEGYYFLNSNNKFRQPHVIGPTGKAIPPEAITVDDVYSGAWYRVMLEFWYYDMKGNKGISTSVAAVMKIRDDVNLGSGTSKKEAESEFGDFADEVVVPEMDASAGEEDTTKDDAESFDFL